MVRVPAKGVPKAEVKGEAPEPPIRKGEAKGEAAQRVPEPPIRRPIKIGEGSNG